MYIASVFAMISLTLAQPPNPGFVKLSDLQCLMYENCGLDCETYCASFEGHIPIAYPRVDECPKQDSFDDQPSGDKSTGSANYKCDPGETEVISQSEKNQVF